MTSTVSNDTKVEGWGVFFLSVEAFLFLLVDCFTLFQVLKIFPINSLREQPIPPVSLTGGKTRTFFICLVFVANLVRAISLWTICYMESNGGIFLSSIYGWELYLIRSFPTLLFLSTYSVIILFWAQVYYAAILVSYPLLRPLSIFFNILIYCIYIALAVLTLLLKAFDNFVLYSTFFIGLIYCATSAGFAYFGIKVANKLAERNKEEPKKNSIIKRVIFLSVVCPIIFAFRGIYSLVYSMQIISHFYSSTFDRLILDAFIYFISEWVPSVFILITFWHRKSKLYEQVQTLEYSTPLINNTYNPYCPQPRIRDSHVLCSANQNFSVANAVPFYEGY